MAAETITEPLDLRQFLAAVEAAADDEFGFDLDDALAVEEAWEQDDDGEVVMHGFIVALRDGGRLYLEYKTTRDDDEEDAEWSILPLEAGMDRPDLGEEKAGIYWYKPDHITTHLYTLRPVVDGGKDEDED